MGGNPKDCWIRNDNVLCLTTEMGRLVQKSLCPFFYYKLQRILNLILNANAFLWGDCMLLITVKRWGTEELLESNTRNASWLYMPDLVFLNCDFWSAFCCILYIQTESFFDFSYISECSRTSVNQAPSSLLRNPEND